MPSKFTLACIGLCVLSYVVCRLFVPDIGGWIFWIPVAFAAMAYRAFQRRSG